MQVIARHIRRITHLISNLQETQYASLNEVSPDLKAKDQPVRDSSARDEYHEYHPRFLENALCQQAPPLPPYALPRPQAHHAATSLPEEHSPAKEHDDAINDKKATAKERHAAWQHHTYQSIITPPYGMPPVNQVIYNDQAPPQNEAMRKHSGQDYPLVDISWQPDLILPMAYSNAHQNPPSAIEQVRHLQRPITQPPTTKPLDGAAGTQSAGDPKEESWNLVEATEDGYDTVDLEPQEDQQHATEKDPDMEDGGNNTDWDLCG